MNSFRRYLPICAVEYLVSVAFVYGSVTTYNLTQNLSDQGWVQNQTTLGRFTGLNQLVSSPVFSSPITNLVFNGKVSGTTTTRIVNFTCGATSVTWKYGSGTTTVTDTDSDFFSIVFAPEDNRTSFSMSTPSKSGGQYNFYVNSVTVYTVDPPPTIDTILDQEASTASDLVVHFSVTSFDGDDPPTFSATAQNLDDPSATYSDDRFNFAPNYSVMRPGYYDFTFCPPEGFEPCSIRFTITATGRGGSASQSFDCTFTEGAVPTPPQVWTPTYNPAFVLAGRTITLQVDYVEADGD